MCPPQSLGSPPSCIHAEPEVILSYNLALLADHKIVPRVYFIAKRPFLVLHAINDSEELR